MIILTCSGFTLFALILYLFRSRKLRNMHVVIWFIISTSLIVAGLFLKSSILISLSSSVGISYPPTLYLLIALVSIVLLVLFLFLEIVKHERQIVVLSQEVGLLRNRFDEKESN